MDMKRFPPVFAVRANYRPAFGGKVGTTIRSICLIQKLYFQQSLYYKIYDSFPRFLRSKMAGGALCRPRGELQWLFSTTIVP